MLKPNLNNKDSVKKSKLPKLSVELTSVMFSAMIFALEDKNQFMGVISAFLAAPATKKFLPASKGCSKRISIKPSICLPFESCRKIAQTRKFRPRHRFLNLISLLNLLKISPLA